MTTRIDLDLAFIRTRLIPAAYHAQTWIAGSAVLDPAHASDLDVWVVGITAEEREELRAHLRGVQRTYPWAVREASYVVDPVTGEIDPESGVGKVMLLSGISRELGPLPIQVLGTQRTDDITHLLGAFDLSVTQWAVNLADNRYPVSLPTSTLPLQPITATSLRTPAHSLARLQKLSARYAQPFTLHPAAMQLQNALDTQAA